MGTDAGGGGGEGMCWVRGQWGKKGDLCNTLKNNKFKCKKKRKQINFEKS